ncbi:hypothetical protein EJB05_36931, partial [Eragrostis curvula]
MTSTSSPLQRASMTSTSSPLQRISKAPWRARLNGVHLLTLAARLDGAVEDRSLHRRPDLGIHRQDALPQRRCPTFGMPAFLLLRDCRDAVLSRAALELLRSYGKPIKLLGCLTVVVGSLLPALNISPCRQQYLHPEDIVCDFVCN